MKHQARGLAIGALCLDTSLETNQCIVCALQCTKQHKNGLLSKDTYVSLSSQEMQVSLMVPCEGGGRQNTRREQQTTEVGNMEVTHARLEQPLFKNV